MAMIEERYENWGVFSSSPEAKCLRIMGVGLLICGVGLISGVVEPEFFQATFWMSLLKYLSAFILFSSGIFLVFCTQVMGWIEFKWYRGLTFC